MAYRTLGAVAPWRGGAVPALPRWGHREEDDGDASPVLQAQVVSSTRSCHPPTAPPTPEQHHPPPPPSDALLLLLLWR